MWMFRNVFTKVWEKIDGRRWGSKYIMLLSRTTCRDERKERERQWTMVMSELLTQIACAASGKC